MSSPPCVAITLGSGVAKVISSSHANVKNPDCPVVTPIFTSVTVPVPFTAIGKQTSTSVAVTLTISMGTVFFCNTIVPVLAQLVTKLVTFTVYDPSPIKSVVGVLYGLAVLFVGEFDALNKAPAPSGSLVHTKL